MRVRAAVVTILALGVSATRLGGQTVGPANPLVRNCVPAAWQAADVRWVRDVAPHNKVDDLIDSTSDSPLDLVVNFNRCIRQSDLNTLAQLSPEGRVVLKGTFIPFASMSGVARAHVPAIAALPQVAFVERKFGFSGTLNVSVANIRVASAPGLTDTVQDRFPEINGTGINIAILDSGVNNPGGAGTTHRAFPNAAAFYDAVTADNPQPPRDPNTNPDDDSGHGTLVASIALGRSVQGTTGTFPRGVAPRAGLIDVRVFNSATDPCGTTGAWDDAVRGLQQVYLNRRAWNVQVVNLSIHQCDNSGPVASDGLDSFSQLVDLAESMGIVVVAAAANDGPNNQGLTAPAAATRAITVAASDDHNSTDRSLSTSWPWSNRGPRDDDGDGVVLDELKPDVTAPGVDICAAARDSETGSACGPGTSFAAPHVAGLAALILQERPGMHPASVKQLLIQTAERKGTPSPPGVDLGWSKEWGFGLVNGFAAINLLRQESQQADLTFPNFPPTPAWDSNDITTRDRPRVNVANEARVRILNQGPNPARNVRVQFGVFDYSVSIPAFHDIGTVIVGEILSDKDMTVSIPWTPKASGHLCLQVEIGYGSDSDPSNNVAQRNLRVAESPVTFEVRNTLTEEPAEIHFVPTFDPPTSNWTVTITPPAVTLAADDCPVQIEVLLSPLSTATPGSVQQVDVAAMIGDVLLGGVTVEDSVPSLPDCNLNGIDNTEDIASGASQDINNNGTPDECKVLDLPCTFSGTAQGGQVSVSLAGFTATCTVSIVTTAGQSPSTVAANLAAAINADACMSGQGITATASGNSVRMVGFLLRLLGSTITDPGIHHSIPIVAIPALTITGVALMALLLLLAGVFFIARQARRATYR